MEIPDRESEQTNKPAGADSCPLSHREQTRNLVLFGVNTGLFYLAAPVLLVGNLQATLCERLGASNKISNLPGSAYLIMAATPVLVAWLFPQVALLKRILVISYAALAAIGAVVVAFLFLPVPDWVKIAVVILEGAVTGAALTVATTLLFEMLGRGVSLARRGIALGLGYGVGPIFAVVGSLAAQMVLDGKVGPLELGKLDYPFNFAAIFAVTVPIMALAAFLSTFFVLPATAEAASQELFLAGLFDGFANFLSRRVLRVAAGIAILGFATYAIGPNLTRYAPLALSASSRESPGSEKANPETAQGGDPQPVASDKYVGYQLALRFSFKVMSGLLMGWLVTWASPKAAVLITASFGFSGIVWGLGASGPWFLLSFGLVGAGELFGVYITNYILCCSSPAQTRPNMGIASFLMLPAASAGPLFGAIADHLGTDLSQGFQMSIGLAAVFMGVAICLIGSLPARPRPEAE